jgi:hypothetical protein
MTKGGHRFLPSLPNREPLGLRSKPRRQRVAANGASGLAAGQPRKSEAALVVDWFYYVASWKWLPPKRGDRLTISFLPENGARKTAFPPVSMINMRLKK